MTNEICNCYSESRGQIFGDAEGDSVAANTKIQTWHIDRLVFYARNPRKNDAPVDRVCEFIVGGSDEEEYGHQPRSRGPDAPPSYPTETLVSVVAELALD